MANNKNFLPPYHLINAFAASSTLATTGIVVVKYLDDISFQWISTASSSLLGAFTVQASLT